MSEVFQPLELFHDSHGSIFLIAREGLFEGLSYLSTYKIDVDNMMSQKVSQTKFDKDFNSAFRTRNHLVLASSEDEMLYAFGP